MSPGAVGDSGSGQEGAHTGPLCTASEVVSVRQATATAIFASLTKEDDSTVRRTAS